MTTTVRYVAITIFSCQIASAIEVASTSHPNVGGGIPIQMYR